MCIGDGMITVRRACHCIEADIHSNLRPAYNGYDWTNTDPPTIVNFDSAVKDSVDMNSLTNMLRDRDEI